MDGAGRLWPRADLRVGDADRQGVVAELQRHFVDGRLSSDELAERVAHTLSARTFGELAVPLEDLPALVSSPPRQPLATTPSEDRPRASRFGSVLGALLIAFGVLALVWMVAFPTQQWGAVPFWPIFFVGFFFVGRPRRGSRRHRWHRGEPPTRYL
jgi:hypothetical protein